MTTSGTRWGPEGTRSEPQSRWLLFSFGFTKNFDGILINRERIFLAGFRFCGNVDDLCKSESSICWKFKQSSDNSNRFGKCFPFLESFARFRRRFSCFLLSSRHRDKVSDPIFISEEGWTSFIKIHFRHTQQSFRVYVGRETLEQRRWLALTTRNYPPRTFPPPRWTSWTFNSRFVMTIPRHAKFQAVPRSARSILAGTAMINLLNNVDWLFS